MSKYDKAGLAMIPSGYKASKVYSLIPNSSDGDFDFTRASTATRVNKDGLIDTVASGVPRLEYPIINGVVGDTPSLLLEPSRTNLVTYSEDFSQSYYTKSNCTITSNSIISPDGTQNASKITEDSTFNNHRISINGFTGSGTHTISVFAKANSRNWLLIRNASNNAWFDVLNGYVGSVQSGTGNIEYYGNGWYKCSVTMSSLSTPAFGIADNNDSYTYQGNGTGNLYIWGTQVEVSDYPTSYIPTSGTTVTRAVETCNGAGTSAEFNDSEGVLFGEISALYDTQINRFLGINDGSNSNRVIIGYTSVDSNTPRGIITSGGVAQAAIDFTINDITENIKIAIKYKTDRIALWINGFKVGTDTSATMPTGLDNFSFDSDGVGGSDFYGKVKQVIAFKEALSDSELEDLTSWDSFNEMATAQEYIIK